MNIKQFFSILFFLSMLTACSISFSNISTHGNANDLIDEDMKADADVKPNLNLPAL